jgi:BolA protein
MASAVAGPLEAQMRASIQRHLTPTFLELENESHKHGSGPGGESHFKVLVVSSQFDGKSLLERHRLVNDAVKDGSTNIPVHALSISAKTVAQWEAAGGKLQMHSTPNCAGGDGSGAAASAATSGGGGGGAASTAPA